MTLRNIMSTNAGADVTDEYAEAVEAIVNEATAERETHIRSQHGEIDYRVVVVSYASPETGETVWAVDYNDPASRELEEAGTREEAAERYEELVRLDAAQLDTDQDGNPQVFTVTDVPGVPGYAGIWFEVATSSDDEVWQATDTGEETLDAPQGSSTDADGEAVRRDPHADAAREILASLITDMQDVQLVDAAQVERELDASGAAFLSAGGHLVSAWQVTVYNGTADDRDRDPAATATAYIRAATSDHITATGDSLAAGDRCDAERADAQSGN